MIGKRFVQRGYSGAFVMKKIEEVSALEREELNNDKPKQPAKQYDVPIILDYNIYSDK